MITTKKKTETAYLDIAIPPSIENLQLPDPTLVTFYKNLENRILWIDAEINTMTLEFAKYIMQWNFEDKGKPIEDGKSIKILFLVPAVI